LLFVFNSQLFVLLPTDRVGEGLLGWKQHCRLHVDKTWRKDLPNLYFKKTLQCYKGRMYASFGGKRKTFDGSGLSVNAKAGTIRQKRIKKHNNVDWQAMLDKHGGVVSAPQSSAASTTPTGTGTTAMTPRNATTRPLERSKVCQFRGHVVIAKIDDSGVDHWILQMTHDEHCGHFPHNCSVARKPLRIKDPRELAIAGQVVSTYGGTGAARALYYYRTGDILDNKTLHRLNRVHLKAAFGEVGQLHPCDELISELREKAAVGELDYMLIFAQGGSQLKALGETYHVGTTFVSGGDGETTATDGLRLLVRNVVIP
jgi:hypothetical protein